VKSLAWSSQENPGPQLAGVVEGVEDRRFAALQVALDEASAARIVGRSLCGDIAQQATTLSTGFAGGIGEEIDQGEQLVQARVGASSPASRRSPRRGGCVRAQPRKVPAGYQTRRRGHSD